MTSDLYLFFGITLEKASNKKVSNDFTIQWNTLMKILYLKGCKSSVVSVVLERTSKKLLVWLYTGLGAG